MPELDARKKEFAALNAQVMDISVDSIPSHIAWRREEVGIAFAKVYPIDQLPEIEAVLGALRKLS